MILVVLITCPPIYRNSKNVSSSVEDLALVCIQKKCAFMICSITILGFIVQKGKNI
jgi:hypothetical protein